MPPRAGKRKNADILRDAYDEFGEDGEDRKHADEMTLDEAVDRIEKIPKRPKLAFRSQVKGVIMAVRCEGAPPAAEKEPKLKRMKHDLTPTGDGPWARVCKERADLFTEVWRESEEKGEEVRWGGKKHVLTPTEWNMGGVNAWQNTRLQPDRNSQYQIFTRKQRKERLERLAREGAEEKKAPPPVHAAPKAPVPKKKTAPAAARSSSATLRDELAESKDDSFREVKEDGGLKTDFTDAEMRKTVADMDEAVDYGEFKALTWMRADEGRRGMPENKIGEHVFALTVPWAAGDAAVFRATIVMIARIQDFLSDKEEQRAFQIYLARILFEVVGVLKRSKNPILTSDAERFLDYPMYGRLWTGRWHDAIKVLESCVGLVSVFSFYLNLAVALTVDAETNSGIYKGAVEGMESEWSDVLAQDKLIDSENEDSLAYYITEINKQLRKVK